MEPTIPASPPDGKDTTDLVARLDVWVSEGLIDRADADAIAAYESGSPPSPRRSRVTPTAEGLAYLGGALAVAAVGTALGGQWSELSTAARIAIATVIWLSLLVAGWRFLDGSPPLMRLSRVLWLLSVAALAWSSQLVFHEGFDVDGRAGLLATGVATAVYASALYLARPSSLQQLAVAGGLLLIATAFREYSPMAAGFGLWALGVAWIVLGWRWVLVEPGTAATIGSVLVMFGAVYVAIQDEEVGAWMAVVSSAGLIGAGVGLRHTAVMVIGTIALFFSTIETIGEYVEGSTGIALGLLVAGVLVSAVALAVWRSGRGARASLGSGS